MKRRQESVPVSVHAVARVSSISLDDRDAAVQTVIATLRQGLPVSMSFNAASDAIADGAGGTLSLRDDLTWFLPPELAGCSADALNSAFSPHDGHQVNLIGFSIVPGDAFRSYFIVMNNWGKGSGQGGNYAMTFAAFKLLAGGLQTYKLTCSLPSNVYANPQSP